MILGKKYRHVAAAMRAADAVDLDFGATPTALLDANGEHDRLFGRCLGNDAMRSRVRPISPALLD